MNIQFGNLFGPTKTFFEFLFMTRDMDHNKEKETFKKNFGIFGIYMIFYSYQRFDTDAHNNIRQTTAKNIW